MAKPIPVAPEMMALLMPITSPRMLTSGPPELPGLIEASVWRKSVNSRSPRSEGTVRPTAESTPVVTVFDRPKGVADGDHRLADHQVRAAAERQGGQAARLHLEHGDVGVAVRAQEVGLQLAAVEQGDGDPRGPLDHVGVGDHDAVAVDDQP